MNFDNNLPDYARVWVYAGDRNFSENELRLIVQRLQRFVESWTAHKIKVVADATVLHNRFIVLMADEQKVGVSGCSIDSSVHFIKSLGTELGIDFFNRLQVHLLENGVVKSLPPSEFLARFNAGEIGDDTVVFDTLVTTKQALTTIFQKPLSKSRVQRMLSVSAPVFSL